MKKIWKHKDKPKRKYDGHYKYLATGKERVFLLICTEPEHMISFESHQMAKKLGWY